MPTLSEWQSTSITWYTINRNHLQGTKGKLEKKYSYELLFNLIQFPFLWMFVLDRTRKWQYQIENQPWKLPIICSDSELLIQNIIDEYFSSSFNAKSSFEHDSKQWFYWHEQRDKENLNEITVKFYSILILLLCHLCSMTFGVHMNIIRRLIPSLMP